MTNYYMATEYDTIKLVRPTRLELDKLKKSMGLPSYSQTISALVEHQKVKEEIINEIKKDLAEESTKIIANLFYRFALDIMKDIKKPPAETTLLDLINIITKKNGFGD